MNGMLGSTTVLKSGTLLVATRDEALLSGIRTSLGDLPFDIRSVEGGGELLDRFQPENVSLSGRVKLLILDEDLLDVQGSSILSEIRQLDPDMKVIFVAAEATSHMEMMVRREGVLFFLHKPVSLRILKSVLAKAVEHETERYRVGSD